MLDKLCTSRRATKIRGLTQHTRDLCRDSLNQLSIVPVHKHSFPIRAMNDRRGEKSREEQDEVVQAQQIKGGSRELEELDGASK